MPVLGHITGRNPERVDKLSKDFSEQTLYVRNGNEINGFCFTPQDGNSLLSSLSATLWFLYPHSYKDKLNFLSNLFFDHI